MAQYLHIHRCMGVKTHINSTYNKKCTKVDVLEASKKLKCTNIGQKDTGLCLNTSIDTVRSPPYYWP